jgi:hypothetical protein
VKISRVPDRAASSITRRRNSPFSTRNGSVPKPKISISGSMVWWLWNSRKSLRAHTARPTVIFPTAGGPMTNSSSP